MFKIARLLCLTTVIACFTASSRAQLFVANAGNGTVGEYNTDGSAINSALITFSDVTNFPRGLVVSGSNIYTCSPSGTVGFSTDDGTFHGDIIFGLQAAFLGMALSGNTMYVANPNIGYLITYTISPAGASLVSYPLISGFASLSGGIVVVGTNIYAADSSANSVGLYSTSGLVINRNLISGLNQPYGLAVVGTNLYVSTVGNNTVGRYSTSGLTINAAMITGLHLPMGLASDGTNLFVANFQDLGGDTIGSYTLTGATNNASLITGLHSPVGLAWRSTAASPVTLSAGLSGANVVLSWPSSGATFRLLQNTNLTNGNWVAVTNVPVVNGTTNQVTLPVTNATFFDLVNP